jgi:FAD synthetase
MRKVLAGGVFNVIHPGHIYFLKEAKKHGDYLVVVVANDKTGKAALPAKLRKKMVESLGFVDKVVIGGSGDRMAVVRKEKPDIVVLGYDQDMDVKGIPVKRIGKLEGFSTNEILRKIKKKK